MAGRGITKIGESTMFRRYFLLAAPVMAALAILAVVPATAQPYPNRPVKIIVPTPAGGPVDVMARLLANALPAVLGQNVIVENRAGAGNTLGSKAAAAPTGLVAEPRRVLVAHRATPFGSVAALVAYAKANPGRLNYSTGGAGTLPHLTAELFKQLSGTDIVHVPYKGGGPALTDVVAGQIQITFDTVRTSAQFIRDRRLNPLAVSTPTRRPEMRKWPT